MPSFIGTPAQIAWTGGTLELEPIRFSIAPAVLSWSGKILNIGASLTTGLAVTKPRLDRLTRGQEYYDNRGYVGVQMQSLWQKNVESVEGAFAGLIEQVAAIQAALDAAQAAQDTATDAAQQALDITNSVTLANSTTVPVDGNLTATSAGVITIAAHQRYYTEDNIVSVNGGSIEGLSESVFYRVKYQDAAWEGGAVAYEATTEDVSQTVSTHIVGGITIPAAGEPPSSGVGTTPPGYVRPPIDRDSTV